MEKVRNNIIAAIYECCAPEHCSMILSSNSFIDASELACGDLLAYVQKDPAMRLDPDLIIMNTTSYSAVLHYRIANAIYGNKDLFSPKLRTLYAGLLSQRGKLKSGAEVHFKARIGKSFVLDHGYGTVIGETTIIGEDCYILGGVILGARGISDNQSDARHPILGNNVQVGSFSSVLGRVKVGDNTFIGPSCTITKDIPSGSKVLNEEYNKQHYNYGT